jgi:hypothetical protein
MVIAEVFMLASPLSPFRRSAATLQHPCRSAYRLWAARLRGPALAV